jgi:hypothetical protein
MTLASQWMRLPQATSPPEAALVAAYQHCSAMKTKEDRIKAAERRLQERAMPILVRMRLLALFEAGLIDTSRATDPTYLASRLIDDALYDRAPSRMFVETESSFTDAARLLGRRGDKESAVILLFTAVEHVTNFYIRVFSELRKHDGATISEMISAPHPLKIAVILPSLGVDLTEPMKAGIRELRAIRNRIVHFDHVPMIIHRRDEREGSDDKLRKALAGIVLTRFYLLPQSMREHCEKIYQAKHPHYQAMLAAARLLGCA